MSIDLIIVTVIFLSVGIYILIRYIEEKKKIKIVITFDHRIINGKEAALFVKELKEKFKDKKYIEGLS
jgi:translation initiation factor IF-3